MQEIDHGEIIQNLTPSERIVGLLFEPHRVPASDIRQLEGQRVMVMDLVKHQVGEDRIIGTVTSVGGRIAVVEPDVIHRYRYEDEEDIHISPEDGSPRIVNVEYFTPNPDQSDVVDFEDPSVSLALYGKLPNRMGVNGDIFSYDKVGFDRRDPLFDLFVSGVLGEIGEVKDYSDLVRLTDFLHANIAYAQDHAELSRERAKEFYYSLQFEDTPPQYREDVRIFAEVMSRNRLGEIIASHRAVCLQIAAAEFAILRLMGLNVELIENYRHAYVSVDLGEIPGITDPIIVDPTWNVVGTHSDVLNHLINQGLSTRSHLPATERVMKFEPDWARADFIR